MTGRKFHWLSGSLFLAIVAGYGLIAATALAQSPPSDLFMPVLAVDEIPTGSSDPAGKGLYDPSLIPIYKGAGTAVGVLLTFFTAWFLYYPWALAHGKTWPVTLFGCCTAAAWVVSWIIALSIYWYDLPISPFTPWWREWGLRGIGFLLMTFFGVFCRANWRSEAQTRAS